MATAPSGRRIGVLTDWNDHRGFGWITPADGGARVFVHVSAFPGGRRPVAGCRLSFVEGAGRDNKVRAEQVRHVGSAARSGASRRSAGLGSSWLLVAVFSAVLVSAVLLDRLPWFVPVGYLVLSLVEVLLYRRDKSAAVRGTWRTPEQHLHLVALLGGWPGALLARQAFRHKTTKQPFVTVLWLTVLANCAALVWFVARTVVG